MGKINGEQHTNGPSDVPSLKGERVQGHLTSDLSPAHVFVCVAHFEGSKKLSHVLSGAFLFLSFCFLPLSKVNKSGGETQR